MALIEINICLSVNNEIKKRAMIDTIAIPIPMKGNEIKIKTRASNS